MKKIATVLSSFILVSNALIAQTKQPVTPANSASKSGSKSCIYSMSERDFETSIKTIKSKSSEQQKLDLAKQVLKTNCMKSMQIKEILGLFAFEETKLDFAKFAYKSCTDPENYSILEDSFTFEASMNELNEFIKKSK